MNKTRPTDDQIKAEINQLHKMKPKVRQYSAFDDDHHAAIEAQIEVLQDSLVCGDMFFDEEALEEVADVREWAHNVRDAALEALQFVEGDHESSPSRDWESLVRK